MASSEGNFEHHSNTPGFTTSLKQGWKPNHHVFESVCDPAFHSSFSSSKYYHCATDLSNQTCSAHAFWCVYVGRCQVISLGSTHVRVKHPWLTPYQWHFFMLSAHWEHNLSGKFSQSLPSVATGSGAALAEGVWFQGMLHRSRSQCRWQKKHLLVASGKEWDHLFKTD